MLDKPIKSRETLDRLLDTILEFISQPVKDLVLVGGDATAASNSPTHIGGEQFRVTEVSSGQEAIEVARGAMFDCLVLQSTPPDMAVELLRTAGATRQTCRTLPVILYSTRRRESRPGSPAKWVNESVSFSRGFVSGATAGSDRVLPALTGRKTRRARKRRILEHLYQTDHVLSGRTV